MDISIPYGTVSSVVFTIFGKNFRQYRAQRRPGHTHLLPYREEPLPQVLFPAIDLALSSTK